MPETIITVTIDDAHAGARLDRALAAILAVVHPELTRSRLKALIESGAVSGPANQPSAKVKPGETYAVTLAQAAPATPQGQSMALDILHEDDALIVLDKPAGLVVHPAPGNPDRTLVNALIAHCGPGLTGIGGVARPGIVHRLDKDTSGLMVVAKTDLAHQALQKQFQDRTVERVYVAIVRGVPPAEGEIEAPIGRSTRDRKRMAITAKGRHALTRYRLRQVLFRGRASVIECRLATGRTHQIRVHLASIGHPLLGDPVYGGRLEPDLARVAARFGRQALDAIVLGFDHPTERIRRRYEKPLSGDMTALIRDLDAL